MDERRTGGSHGKAIVTGVVRSLNFAPKGEVEGIILDADGVRIQVNLPPDRGGAAARLLGREVAIVVVPEPASVEHGPGDHPVHRFVRFRDEPGFDGPALEGHDGAADVEVGGAVARLNFAKHGAPNGVVLDTGDFLHLKPEGMQRAGLRLDQEVSALGKGSGRSGRAIAVEAEVVNGVDVSREGHRAELGETGAAQDEHCD